jgi:trans-aconitate methyltransferase
VKIDQASTLIHTPDIEWTRPQSWCDLGCGGGTFTVALAQSLAPGSTIQAIDLDQSALDEIPQRIDGVEIRKVIGDLQNPNLVLPSVMEFLWQTPCISFGTNMAS